MASRYTFRLKPDRDADLIVWLDSLGDGERSCFIRNALRRSLKEPQFSQAPNPIPLKQSTPSPPTLSNENISSTECIAESDFTAKLDQLAQCF
jgi:hypothetical protein